MADNTQLNLGSGGDVARTNDRAGVKTPVVMLDLGSDGTESIVDGTSLTPTLVPVGGRVTSPIVTPTVGTAAYVTGDALGGLLTFTSAARISGGTISVDKVTVVDKASQSYNIELWLFSATITATTDSSAFAISDADALLCVGVIPIATWYLGANNGVASRFGLGFVCTLAGTSLFGQMVTRSSGTSTNGDIQVQLDITQN